MRNHHRFALEPVLDALRGAWLWWHRRPLSRESWLIALRLAREEIANLAPEVADAVRWAASPPCHEDELAQALREEEDAVHDSRHLAHLAALVIYFRSRA